VSGIRAGSSTSRRRSVVVVVALVVVVSRLVVVAASVVVVTSADGVAVSVVGGDSALVPEQATAVRTRPDARKRVRRRSRFGALRVSVIALSTD
jgi:hypothetical protein